MAILSNNHLLRIDIGNYCNLECPSCPRSTLTKTYNKKNKTLLNRHPYLNTHNISLDEVKQWFPKNFLVNHVREVMLCGAFAEPSLSPFCKELINYFSPFVEIVTMSTNGSTKNIDWWKDLASTKVYVDFHIDSIKPNNNIYRIGSSTEKIIENIKAFTSAGGRAKLTQILFKHNQDEIDTFKTLAKKLNCEYNLRVGHEFVSGTEITSYDVETKGGKSYKIEKNTIISSNEKYSVVNDNPHSYCTLTKEKTIMVLSNGIVYPCCFIEVSLFDAYEDFLIDESKTKPNKNKQSQFYKDFVSKIELQGGIKSLSLKYNSIFDIMNSSLYRKTLEMSWKLKSNKTCIKCINGATNIIKE
jgi:MoaA/NifB/PqqE/SkfB family radical SAM enzyme